MGMGDLGDFSLCLADRHRHICCLETHYPHLTIIQMYGIRGGLWGLMLNVEVEAVFNPHFFHDSRGEEWGCKRISSFFPD